VVVGLLIVMGAVAVRFFERALRLRLDRDRLLAAARTGEPVRLLREFCGRVCWAVRSAGRAAPAV